MGAKGSFSSRVWMTWRGSAGRGRYKKDSHFIVADLPRIRLFLTNLWEWVEQDEQDFRDEVGTTFLHELGHYLGWDEDEVNERGLE